MYSKKGLSGIVTTLIIIGIALAAVGVIWYVLNTVVEEQAGEVTDASSAVYQSCADASAGTAMNSTASCDVSVTYHGGEKCCSGTIS